MKLTLDANLFIARFRQEDAVHQQALDFFEECERKLIQFFAPIILLGEVAGALSRIRHDPKFGELAITRILALPRLRLRQIDSDFAEDAARIAARHELRSVDALYLALAKETKSTLVSWDRELLNQTSALVRVITPQDWRKANSSPH